MSFVPRIVIPGELVPEVDEDSNDKQLIILGPGLRRETGSAVSVTKAGVLRKRSQEQGNHDIFWVDCHR